MFWLLVLWPVVSFSNVWNGIHLRNASHGETHLMLNFEIGFVKAGIAEIRLTVSNAIKLTKNRLNGKSP